MKNTTGELLLDNLIGDDIDDIDDGDEIYDTDNIWFCFSFWKLGVKNIL